MKIKEWIAIGVVMVLATASRSLGAPEMGILDHLEQTETTAHSIETNVRGQEENLETRWQELDKFQAAVWRAMALDPTSPVNVPPAEVPKSLFAAQLNRELNAMFEEIKKSTLPKELGAQVEFEQYVATAIEILSLRAARKFPEARAIAKRGKLDAQFELLKQKLGKPEPKKAETLKQVQQLLNEIEKTRDSWVSQAKETERKNIFSSSNQKFAWVMVAILLGFFLGIAAYRISPDFFQKFLDATEVASGSGPTPPQFNAGSERLDYARWLRELEEHLTRFKTSQLSHERRIEEVIGVSEKITQQALSLYADPRIKSEANLEMRMSNLLREIQHQFEQGQKLAGGDRAQVQQMLEHCLRLCDAIETGGIQYPVKSA